MGKFEIRNINLNKNIIAELAEIWEHSVSTTHDFLTKDDIKNIKSQVLSTFNSSNSVVCAVRNGKILAFMVVENYKIEMLFVDSCYLIKVSAKCFKTTLLMDLVLYMLMLMKIMLMQLNFTKISVLRFLNKLKPMSLEILLRF